MESVAVFYTSPVPMILPFEVVYVGSVLITSTLSSITVISVIMAMSVLRFRKITIPRRLKKLLLGYNVLSVMKFKQKI